MVAQRVISSEGHRRSEFDDQRAGHRRSEFDDQRAGAAGAVARLSRAAVASDPSLRATSVGTHLAIGSGRQ